MRALPVPDRIDLEPTGLSFVADCGNAISRLAMAIPNAYLDSSGEARRAMKWQTIAGLLASLPQTVTVVLLAEQRNARRLREVLDDLDLKCGLEIADSVPDRGLDDERALWIQDSFLVSGTPASRRYIYHADAPFRHGSWLADWDGSRAEASPWAFEGGNCLVGPDFWLLGARTVRKGAERIGLSSGAYETACRAFSSFDSRPMVMAGYGRAEAEGASSSRDHPLYQPLDFHIDLILSVTGIRREGRPVLLLAEPVGSHPDGKFGDGLRRRFDSMGGRLRRAGFEVIRNPMPIDPLPGGCSAAMPRYYNNVLVQNVPTPMVWLPQFGDQEPACEETDAANVELWKKLGFHVIGLPGWSTFASDDGAMRCMTKVIERWV